MVVYAGIGFFAGLYQILTIGTPAVGEAFPWFSVVFFGGTAAGVWAARFTPVKVTDAQGDLITIKFSSDDYAKSFMALNAAPVGVGISPTSAAR